MKAILGTALLAATLVSSAASAADLYASRSPYAAPERSSGYFWQGPYVGANLGYQWGSVSNSGTSPSGAAGGITAGYNWQNGQFVFGGETDLQLSGADDVFAAWKFSNPWFGTLRARGGLAYNNILFYGTVGLAYGGLRAESVVTGVTESKTSIGWTAGAGMEVAMTPAWSVKAEYLYIGLADRSYGITGTDNGIGSSLLRVGVNYHF
jgi:outer membrane immunogenic protein